MVSVQGLAFMDAVPSGPKRILSIIILPFRCETPSLEKEKYFNIISPLCDQLD